MVSTLILAFAMLAADPLETTRLAYSNCLVEFTGTSLDAAMVPADYSAAVQAACDAEKAAFHAAVVKAERGFGSNADEAAKYADEEVQGVISSMVDGYADYLSSKTRPGKT